MAQTQRNLHEDALKRVLVVASVLGASANLREILQVIIDAIRDSLDAERATVFEYDQAAKELFTTVAHGLDGPTAVAPAVGADHDSLERQIRIPLTQGLAGEAARTGRIINTPDAYADARFNREVDRKTGFRTRSILSIPLIAFDGELIGVAQVLNKRGGPFGPMDEQIAGALASQAAVAIKRGRLIEAQLRRQKMERDLQLARLIQQKTLPTQVPTVRGFDLAVWSGPAEETGGDTYDVIGLIDEVGDLPQIVTNPDQIADRAVVMMADATGHGVGPALMAASVRAMLRMATRLASPLPRVVEHLNHQICQDVPEGRFVTAWVATLDGNSGVVHSFSAGQAPLVYYTAHPDRLDFHDADDMPFGILDTWQVDMPEPIPMQRGDIFAALSDGFFEATNAAGEQFGQARVGQVLAARRDDRADQIIAALRDAVEAFTGGAPPADDRTAVIIKRT